jgi:protein transport protein SEC24
LNWKGKYKCFFSLAVPQAFDWDIINQQHADRYSRPELNYGCVDFVAPADYIVRPPQPPSYVFIIDISFQSVQAGVVSVVADAIKESLDKIPNEDGRAQVAFITVDNAIGFYKLLGREPEMLIVGELNDIYLPRMASDLIVNLVEARNMIDNLLEKMKSMHNQSQSSSNCLGSALQAARKLLVRL